MDSKGELAVINGLIALEDAVTGDHWAPHRFALLRLRLFSCIFSDDHWFFCFVNVWVKRGMFFFILFFGVSFGEAV